MAITETGVVVTTLQGIQGTYTEEGQALQITMDGLTPNTAYRATAYCIENGIQRTSNTEAFQTLPAGTITLEYIQTVRSGYGYDVSYRYTSTYAPTSAILSTNGMQFQGVIDSAQHAISFWVTGLTAGNAYLTNVTLYDIYGNSTTVMGSIVTTVVNEVRITGTTAASTTVECELDYIIDGGFYQGWVDYWLDTQDPAVDPSLGHEYFNDGADTCTISGLTDGTTYKFRATIEYNNGSNSVVSSVVTATTIVDYDSRYFTITNTGNDSLTVTLIKSNVGQVSDYQPVYVSKNGTSWTAYNPSTEGTSLGTLNVGKKMMLKHTGAMSPLGRIRLGITSNYSTTKIELSGNIASLCFGDNFTGTKTMPDYAYASLFTRINNTITQIDTRNLSFASYTSISNFGMQQMFYESNIVYPPDLSCIIEVGNSGMSETFYGCTLLATAPKLNNVRSVGNGGFGHTFYGCTSLRISPKLNNVTSVGSQGCLNMYSGCRRLATAYAPTITWDTGKMKNWLYNVAASGTIYVATEELLDTIVDDNVSGCPTGWTKQLIS